MVKLSETELKALIQGGETNTVELKVAAPRATEMAERLCGMANTQGGVVIIGVKDFHHEIVGVPDKRIGETLDVVLRAVRQMMAKWFLPMRECCSSAMRRKSTFY